MIGVPGEDRGVAVCAEDQSVAVSVFAGLYAALQLISHVSSRVSGCSISSIGDFHMSVVSGIAVCGWLLLGEYHVPASHGGVICINLQVGWGSVPVLCRRCQSSWRSHY